jgi:putative zinc finger/helix-turn-helix YgiT family protein
MTQWMTKCVQCGSDKLREARSTERRTVAGVEFSAELDALKCGKCGETYVDDKALEAMELAIAAELGRLGVLKGEAFKFMRKAIDLRGIDLAELLDVTGDTVSRWERDVVPIDHAAFAVLGALASEARQGRTEMRDRLQAARDAKLPKKPVKVGSR